MQYRLRSFWQSKELRFHLALAFLLWSLVPHYQLILHSHAGSEAGHDHATLTAQEIEFADQALQAFPSALPGEVGGEAVAPSTGPADGLSWSTDTGLLDHAHLLQDLNSVPVLPCFQAAMVPSPGAATGVRPYQAPVPPAPMHRPARGPPAAFLA